MGVKPADNFLAEPGNPATRGIISDPSRATLVIHLSALPAYPTVVLAKYTSSSCRWRS
jgi:hypothetical protein